MKCPRCSAAIAVRPDASGFLVCPSCAAKLRARVPPAAPAASSSRAAPPRAAVDTAMARVEVPRSDATIPSGPVQVPRPPAARPPSAPLPAAGEAATLDTLLAEVRALRRVQDEILALLRKGGGPSARPAQGDVSGGFADLDGDPFPARSAGPAARAQRSALVIDDDDETRFASVSAFETVDVPVRAVSDGNAGLAAIAAERPDVIVLELDLTGAMGGKDVINMIKATMEWVDIPIVLHTRAPVESQKEARTIHGADDFVLKGPGSAEALVAKVTSLFRRA